LYGGGSEIGGMRTLETNIKYALFHIFKQITYTYGVSLEGEQDSSR